MNQKNVEEVLLRMGIPAGLLGFRYIVDAVLLLDKEGAEEIKYTYLYHMVAKKNDSSIERVERAIRHALSIARKKEENHDLVEHYIGFTNKANSSSLKLLYLRLKEEEQQAIAAEYSAPGKITGYVMEPTTEEGNGEVQQGARVYREITPRDKEVFREKLKEMVKDLINEIAEEDH